MYSTVCPGSSVLAHVLEVFSWQCCSTCPILAVLFQLSYPACPFLAVKSCPDSPILSVLTCLSCPACLILLVLFTFVPETPGSYISVPHLSIQNWLRDYCICYRIKMYIEASKNKIHRHTRQNCKQSVFVNESDFQ